MSNVWFIAGAIRGVAAGIAKAALATGDNVVATRWNTTAVPKALGSTEKLLADTLDVMRADQIKAAVRRRSNGSLAEKPDTLYLVRGFEQDSDMSSKIAWGGANAKKDRLDL